MNQESKSNISTLLRSWYRRTRRCIYLVVRPLYEHEVMASIIEAAIVVSSWQKVMKTLYGKICGKKIIFDMPASLRSGAGVFTYKTLTMTRTMRLVRISQPYPYDAVPEVKYVRDENKMSPVNASASSRRGFRSKTPFAWVPRFGIRPFPAIIPF